MRRYTTFAAACADLMGHGIASVTETSLGGIPDIRDAFDFTPEDAGYIADAFMSDGGASGVTFKVSTFQDLKGYIYVLDSDATGLVVFAQAVAS